MIYVARLIACTLLTAAVIWPTPSQADDEDALSLQGAPVSDAPVREQPMRLHIEGAIGNTRHRYGLPSAATKRLSIDYRYNLKIDNRWVFSLSDRLDYITPVEPGTESTLNSLREIFLSWRDEDGSQSVEFGRINLRTGPSYGYNPTDYFRDGSLRTITTADPVSIREKRLGTLMLRYQKLWPSGAASFAIAPKVANGASSASFAADFGATNHSDRVLASWSNQFSSRFSGQALAFIEKNNGKQLGANFTALLSDAAVGHFEASRGSGSMGLGATMANRNRVSTGLTYTTPHRLALTAEYEYNGFAANYADWQTAETRAVGAYLIDALTRQEIASRSAWLLYATQKSAFLKGLDITALMRVNVQDNSRLGWIELRHHWPNFDGALQLKSSSGHPGTEYGLQPQKLSIQVVGAWFF